MLGSFFSRQLSSALPFTDSFIRSCAVAGHPRALLPTPQDPRRAHANQQRIIQYRFQRQYNSI